MRLITFGLLIITLVSGCRRSGTPRPAEPEDDALRAASAAVERFHSDFSSGNVAGICNIAAQDAFHAASDLPCGEYLPKLREKLGSFRATSRRQLPIVADKPLRVGMEYFTTYEKGQAREHFEFLVHGGQARLITYRLASDALTK